MDKLYYMNIYVISYESFFFLIVIPGVEIKKKKNTPIEPLVKSLKYLSHVLE